eukprot:3697521-Lingulodinium_polyedra.AAC.1
MVHETPVRPHPCEIARYINGTFGTDAQKRECTCVWTQMGPYWRHAREHVAMVAQSSQPHHRPHTRTTSLLQSHT